MCYAYVQEEKEFWRVSLWESDKKLLSWVGELSPAYKKGSHFRSFFRRGKQLNSILVQSMIENWQTLVALCHV
jgi:hypothetical protein